MSDGHIIRAGFSSTAFMAGSANVDIAGYFSEDDAQDIIALLNMAIRQVQRQAKFTPLPLAPSKEAE